MFQAIRGKKLDQYLEQNYINPVIADMQKRNNEFASAVLASYKFQQAMFEDKNIVKELKGVKSSNVAGYKYLAKKLDKTMTYNSIKRRHGI